MSEPVAEELVRRAAEGIEVRPAPVDEAIAAAGSHRREQRRRTGAGLTALAVVIIVATWLGSRSSADDRNLPPAPVTRADNPVDVAWWADGRLHLQDVVLKVEDVVSLSELDTGAAYGDSDGNVVLVDEQGNRRRLGRQVPGAQLATSDAQNTVAWVDPQEGTPVLHAYDASAGAEVGSINLAAEGVRFEGSGAGSHPIAVAQGRVFYAAEDGDFTWLPGGAPVPLTTSGDLLDVQSSTKVWQWSDQEIRIQQQLFSVDSTHPGVGGQISPGGQYVLTGITPQGVATGRVHLYDVRTGRTVPTGLGPDEVAVAATFGRGLTVVYVVAHVSSRPTVEEPRRIAVGDPLELRTCEVATQACTTVSDQSATDLPLVLAR